MEFFSLITALAATSVSMLALIVTFYAYRSQTDPDVIVYLESDTKRPTIILLIIENVGAAAAHNISFSIPKDFPDSAFNIDSANGKQFEIMDDGPLIRGIKMLPAGSKRVITWGQSGGISTYMRNKPKLIKVSFCRKNGPQLLHERMNAQSVIEIDSFYGTDVSKVSIHAHLKDISESLKNINNTMKKLQK